MIKKKCYLCGEVRSLTNFSKDKKRKDGHHSYCKKCFNKQITKYRNTEKGFLKMRYHSMSEKKFRNHRYGRKSKCHITFNEFLTAFEKHKSIYGMKSAWGPGSNNLEQHLPMTMIQEGNGLVGKKGAFKGSKLIGSNLSVDRLDSNRDYTLQNIIFIRNDENNRKRDTTYEDCKIQIKLHEERFINMEAI